MADPASPAPRPNFLTGALGDLVADLARRQVDGVVGAAQDLADVPPVQIVVERRRALQRAGGQPPVALLPRGHAGGVVARLDRHLPVQRWAIAA